MPLAKKKRCRGNGHYGLHSDTVGHARHLHLGSAVNTVLNYDSWNFKDGFVLAFFHNMFFTELRALIPTLLNVLLFKLLCNGHE